jgi:hypothetical protein
LFTLLVIKITRIRRIQIKPQILVALLGVAFLTGQARAGALETINFDNLNGAPLGLDVVTTQYANVIFSASGGDEILVTSQNVASVVNPVPYLGSPPNLICTGTAPGTIDCSHDITLTFTALVDNIAFTAYGNQTPAPGQFALADVYQGTIATPILTQQGIPLDVSHTVHCGGTTLDCAGDPQALNFTGITTVFIHSNAELPTNGGTAYDDFAFTVEGGGTIPEPSTLLLTGLGGIVWAGRRFLARKVSL